MRLTRRAALAAGLPVLSGCMGLGTGVAGDGDGTATPSPPRGPVASAPLPASPDRHTYATTGDGGAPVVTYFGNWKCPFCARFATGAGNVFPLSRVVTEYVVPGTLRLRFRALAYEPDGDPFLGPDAARAARAGLAVWNVAPDSYWPFHEVVMAHQPPESERWATTDRLVRFARIAGVTGVDRVRRAIERGTYDDPVRRTTDAAVETGISGTPALAVDGRTVSPSKPRETKRALEAAAGGRS